MQLTKVVEVELNLILRSVFDSVKKREDLFLILFCCFAFYLTQILIHIWVEEICVFGSEVKY